MKEQVFCKNTHLIVTWAGRACSLRQDQVDLLRRRGTQWIFETMSRRPRCLSCVATGLVP